MFKQIYKEIKKYNNIVIARHIGADPDALGSQLALRDSIMLTFPNKKVLAVGNGSAKFTYIGKLDKYEELESPLLIVLDTPDIKRIDGINIENFASVIKIDHHIFIESFGGIEFVDEERSSASELVLELLMKTPLQMNDDIVSKLYVGIVADTDRFNFQNSTAKTHKLISEIIDKYNVDKVSLHSKLYLRPLNEVRLQGYISQNMTVTDNGLCYVKLTHDILSKFKTDASAAGNMVNSFNYIEEVLVWATISEDMKNELIKVNIRSRGPIINTVAEKYNGGGHKFASGAKLSTMEEVDCLLEDLDLVCKKYIEELI